MSDVLRECYQDATRKLLPWNSAFTIRRVRQTRAVEVVGNEGRT